jgi:hypothetical protein
MDLAQEIRLWCRVWDILEYVWKRELQKSSRVFSLLLSSRYVTLMWPLRNGSSTMLMCDADSQRIQQPALEQSIAAAGSEGQ